LRWRSAGGAIGCEIGLLFTAVLFSSWGISLVELLRTGPDQLSWWGLVAAVLLRSQLQTGLFIIGHDAMHGVLWPEQPRRNQALGALALGVYAALPYSKCRRKHQRHHSDTATAHDPDFPADGRADLWSWYRQFMAGYLSWPQMGLLLGGWLLLGLLFQPVNADAGNQCAAVLHAALTDQLLAAVCVRNLSAPPRTTLADPTSRTQQSGATELAVAAGLLSLQLSPRTPPEPWPALVRTAVCTQAQPAIHAPGFAPVAFAAALPEPMATTTTEGWTDNEQRVARQAFDLAYGRAIQELVQTVQQRAGSLSTPEQVWALHDFLSIERHTMEGRFDFRLDGILFVFASLVKDKLLQLTELDGLAADKLAKINAMSRF